MLVLVIIESIVLLISSYAVYNLMQKNEKLEEALDYKETVATNIKRSWGTVMVNIESLKQRGLINEEPETEELDKEAENINAYLTNI